MGPRSRPPDASDEALVVTWPVITETCHNLLRMTATDIG